MTTEKFKSKHFGPDALERIDKCNEIIDDYLAQGLRLTLRQLYYQLVSRNIIPNVEKSYKNLSSLVSGARLAGLIDWDAIEDRVRQPKMVSEFNDLHELAEAAIASYRLPRWEGQDSYAELWVEKDALAGVLWPLAREFHVTLMVNRGYSSQSAMYESANRFREHQDRECRLFYLGDHDPSGEDMVRDIRDRMEMFGIDLQVSKIALTMDQVEEYDPPPNPAKVSDPRADSYIAKHGVSSWEVDALPPEVLSQLIHDQFEAVIDRRKMDKIIAKEEKDKERLLEAVSKLMRKK
jgi:hypothetical protein